MQLKNRRIAVVGGANGIGAAIVRAYVAEGAQVACLDLREEDGEAVVDAANDGARGRAHFFACDATSRARVRKSFGAAAVALGGLDTLVVTVGTWGKVAAESIDDDEFDRVMTTNMGSVFVTNQEIFPHLVENGGGRIINFGSGSGLRPATDAAHYSASKGAVISWTRSLAYAWGKHNITANVVNPAIRGTLMFRDSSEGSSTSLQSRAATEGYSVFPLGSRRFPPVDEELEAGFGDPDVDLAPVLVFLAGDGARFITAQIIAVDGGLTPGR